MILAGPIDVIFGDLTDWVVSVIPAIAAAAGWWIWTRFISAKHKARRAAEEAELAAQEEVAEMILRATDDL